MLVTHEREKLINAIVYFAERVNFLGKIKLFKLLYFLDFEHFRDTGRSVTGLEYHAWKMGPVPVDLTEEVDDPEPDMCKKVSFVVVNTKKGNMLKVSALAHFDNTHFTKRELRLMERLASEFRDFFADEMVEATHLENLPWHKVYVEQDDKQRHIPYEYALRAQDADAMLPAISERRAVVEYFKQIKA